MAKPGLSSITSISYNWVSHSPNHKYYPLTHTHILVTLWCFTYLIAITSTITKTLTNITVNFLAFSLLIRGLACDFPQQSSWFYPILGICLLQHTLSHIFPNQLIPCHHWCSSTSCTFQLYLDTLHSSEPCFPVSRQIFFIFCTPALPAAWQLCQSNSLLTFLLFSCSLHLCDILSWAFSNLTFIHSIPYILYTQGAPYTPYNSSWWSLALQLCFHFHPSDSSLKLHPAFPLPTVFAIPNTDHSPSSILSFPPNFFPACCDWATAFFAMITAILYSSNGSSSRVVSSAWHKCLQPKSLPTDSYKYQLLLLHLIKTNKYDNLLT